MEILYIMLFLIIAVGTFAMFVVVKADKTIRRQELLINEINTNNKRS